MIGCPSRKCRPTNKSLHLPQILFNTVGRLCEPVAAIFLMQEPGEGKVIDTLFDLPLGNFAEILPRFISNLISHVAHKRIFSATDSFIGVMRLMRLVQALTWDS
jgi:hypothetical protein